MSGVVAEDKALAAYPFRAHLRLTQQKGVTAMTLDMRTASLIAVGASVTANCQPCLEINVTRAVRNGVAPQDVADAIEIGRKVRAGAGSKFDAFAATLEIPDTASTVVRDANCGCGL